MRIRFLLLTAILVVVLTSATPALELREDAEWKQQFLGAWGSDPVVTRLVSSTRTNWQMIATLAKEHSEKGRAALLRIAYGEIGKSYAERAAQRYVYSLQNKSEARALLGSSDESVINAGLRALVGQSVDPRLLGRLDEVLNSNSSRLRAVAARVLGRDRQAPLRKKLDLIAQSIATTEKCYDVSRPGPGGGESWFRARFTQGEDSLGEQAFALSELGELSLEELRDLPLPEPGLAHDFMIVGRGQAKDGTIWPDLRAVVMKSPSAYARLLGLEVLLRHQQDEDVLKIVAEKDPLVAEATRFYFRKEGADMSLENTLHPKIYPLRFMAQQGLREIADRKKFLKSE
jgi:hypothetical protein